MLKISVIIVSYNSAAVLRRCLQSIGTGIQVIVADNASQDESVEIASSHGATVIKNCTNLGFGRACNLAVRKAEGNYFLFLNPDATLYPEALARLEEACRAYPDAGALGPRITGPNDAVSFQNTSFIHEQRGRYAREDGIPTGDCCVEFLPGTALLVSRQAFEAAGGFDESIFLYYEDDDLCFRLRQLGYALIYVPAASVCHDKGTSCRLSIAGDYLRHLHLAKSRIYICRKYDLPLCTGSFVKRALIRSIRAASTFNLRKTARYLSTLHAYSAVWFSALRQRLRSSGDSLA